MSLTELWASKLTSGATSVAFTTFREIMRILKQQGMTMPKEQAFYKDHQGRHRGYQCNFEDLLRLIWDPVIVWMDSSASSTSANTSTLPEDQIA